MSVSLSTPATQATLDRLRTELADLAFELERQGRRDAADVVMQIDARVCELVAEVSTEAAETHLSP